MHCNTLIDPVCVVRHVLQSATGGVAGGILGGIAQAISDGLMTFLSEPEEGTAP